MRAILTGRVCATLYCSFTPLSISGWRQSSVGKALCYRSWVRSHGGIITFYLFFSFTSVSKSFLIVLLPLIQFNVNFRDYLYMLTIWILYFHAKNWSVWFFDLLLVTACLLSLLRSKSRDRNVYNILTTVKIIRCFFIRYVIQMARF